MYNLFDDVLLLSEGQVDFHGPREDVRNSCTDRTAHLCKAHPAKARRC